VARGMSEFGDLELDDAIAQDESIAERDPGKGDERDKDREEGGQRMEGAVCAGRNDVFLGEHLDGVGKGWNRPIPETPGWWRDWRQSGPG
jgi:hypothetical protein